MGRDWTSGPNTPRGERRDLMRAWSGVDEISPEGSPPLFHMAKPLSKEEPCLQGYRLGP